MPAGPNTLGVGGGYQGISLSQVLEMERESGTKARCVQHKEEQEQQHSSHRFPSDISDLTSLSEYPSDLSDLTTSMPPPTTVTSKYSTLSASEDLGEKEEGGRSHIMEWESKVGGKGQGKGTIGSWVGEKDSRHPVVVRGRAKGEGEGDTLTTEAERECSGYLLQLACSCE